jgi:hypothetical protein
MAEKNFCLHENNFNYNKKNYFMTEKICYIKIILMTRKKYLLIEKILSRKKMSLMTEKNN